MGGIRLRVSACIRSRSSSATGWLQCSAKRLTTARAFRICSAEGGTYFTSVFVETVICKSPERASTHDAGFTLHDDIRHEFHIHCVCILRCEGEKSSGVQNSHGKRRSVQNTS